MVNCPIDIELEEDYKLSWLWVHTDPGPIIASYFDFQQCLLDPIKDKPTDFFNALFENWMHTIMAEQTNLCARLQIQGKFMNCSSFSTKN